MSETENPREAGVHALKQAQAAARKGDAAGADRWSKTAERMAMTAERLAKLPEPVREDEDQEALRAELRRRLACYVRAIEAGADDEALHEITRHADAQWEAQRNMPGNSEA